MTMQTREAGVILGRMPVDKSQDGFDWLGVY